MGTIETPLVKFHQALLLPTGTGSSLLADHPRLSRLSPWGTTKLYACCRWGIGEVQQILLLVKE